MFLHFVLATECFFSFVLATECLFDLSITQRPFFALLARCGYAEGLWE